MKFRTYIVEDNAVIRDNLMETLEEIAHIESVGTAETEYDSVCWLAANDHQWDLAIVDIFLREGNGLNVLRACQQRDPARKMVVFSNHATADIRSRCAELGADAVFDKSTEIDDLLAYCIVERDRRESAA